MDIEEIKKEGKACKACPFYASRIAEEKAEIVFAPYNYVIDPSIRNVLNVDLKNSFVIIDEAHNIEDFSRSAGSLALESRTVDIMAAEVMKSLKQGYKEDETKKELYFVLSILSKLKDLSQGNSNKGYKNDDDSDNLGKRFKGTDSDNLGQKYSSADSPLEMKSVKFTSINKENKINNQNNNKKANSTMKGQGIINLFEKHDITKEKILLFKTVVNKFKNDDEMKEILSLSTIQTIDLLCFVLEIIFFKNPEFYAFAIQEKILGEFVLNFWLLDSSVIFQPIVNEAKGIVLLSGTLSPFKSFNSELGHNFKYMVEAPHVIDKNNVFVSCIERGYLGKEIKGTYKIAESYEYLDQVKNIILEIRNRVKEKGGTLVFVPSYSFLDNLFKRLEKESHVFVEPKVGSKFDKMFMKYKGSIEKKEGPILLCVYRGRASEGMDFKDNFARAVLAVGIPYPSFKDLEVVSKREYNDRFKEVKGSAWYEIQAYRAVNQAIGRVLRHKEDWGGVFLVDCRYRENRSVEMLSKWVKDNLRVYERSRECIDEFKNFLLNKQ